jgi:hypothetical protein
MSKLRSAYEVYETHGLLPLLVVSKNSARKFLRRSVLSHTERVVRYRYHRRRYGEAAPKPRRVIRVDPAAIEHVLYPPLHRDQSVTKYDTHVLPGEWDMRPVRDEPWFSTGSLDEADLDGRYRIPLDDYAFYRALQLGRESYRAYEAAWREQLVEFPAEPPEKYREMDYMRKYYEIYANIAADGYKSGRELGRRIPYPEFHDVPIYIGRDGQILSAGFGKHRIVIAQILGLDSIPVRVNVRHSRWQERRNAIVSAAGKGQGVDLSDEHPDLRRLVASG